MSQDKIKSLEEKIILLSEENKELSTRNKRLFKRVKKLLDKNENTQQKLLKIYDFLLSSKSLEELE